MTRSRFTVSPIVDSVGMCYLCDGKTAEEVLVMMQAHIGAGRWALQGVEAGPHTSGWAYTIGLTHNFAHPELVVVDGDLAENGSLLNELGGRISRGLRVDASSTVDLDGYVVEFGKVHDSYLADGLCASWDVYNAWIGASPGPLHALQVVLPRSAWCGHHEWRRRCLGVPGVRGFAEARNRATRRARSPRGRRPRR